MWLQPWRFLQTRQKSPSVSPTASSSSIELERTGNIFIFIQSGSFHSTQRGFVNTLFSFRGDKKTICNKFVQMVSKYDQAVCLKPAKRPSVDEEDQRSMINSENSR